MQTLLVDAHAADTPGAAVPVMRGDQILYRGAHGSANIAAGVPLRPGNRFPQPRAAQH